MKLVDVSIFLPRCSTDQDQKLFIAWLHLLRSVSHNKANAQDENVRLFAEDLQHGEKPGTGFLLPPIQEVAAGKMKL